MNFNEWKEDLYQRLKEHLQKHPECKSTSSPAKHSAPDLRLGKVGVMRTAQEYIDEMMVEGRKFDIINMAVLFEDGRFFFVSTGVPKCDAVLRLTTLINGCGEPLGLIAQAKNMDARTSISYCRSFEEHAWAGDRESG